MVFKVLYPDNAEISGYNAAIKDEFVKLNGKFYRRLDSLFAPKYHRYEAMRIFYIVSSTADITTHAPPNIAFKFGVGKSRGGAGERIGSYARDWMSGGGVVHLLIAAGPDELDSLEKVLKGVYGGEKEVAGSKRQFTRKMFNEDDYLRDVRARNALKRRRNEFNAEQRRRAAAGDFGGEFLDPYERRAYEQLEEMNKIGGLNENQLQLYREYKLRLNDDLDGDPTDDELEPEILRETAAGYSARMGINPLFKAETAPFGERSRMFGKERIIGNVTKFIRKVLSLINRRGLLNKSAGMLFPECGRYNETLPSFSDTVDLAHDQPAFFQEIYCFRTSADIIINSDGRVVNAEGPDTNTIKKGIGLMATHYHHWNVTKGNIVIPETVEVTLKEINSRTGQPSSKKHKVNKMEVERRGDLFVKYNCLPGCMKLVK